jgi:hypothetical protein
MFDAEISHIQRPPSSSSSSAVWSPPTSTICEHSFLFPLEFLCFTTPWRSHLHGRKWCQVLFEHWQNPSNLLGKRSLQTTWSRKASTSIVLLMELYTSENAINFRMSSALTPLLNSLSRFGDFYCARRVTFCTAYPNTITNRQLSDHFAPSLNSLTSDIHHIAYRVGLLRNFLIVDLIR